MLAASVKGNRPGSVSALGVRTLRGPMSARAKFILSVVLAALLAGGLGVAIYKRAEIADLLSRGSKVLGERAAAAGYLPLGKSLASLLDLRSPGQRTAGELANDKRRYAARPKQRALGKVRPALPVPFVQALTTPVPEILPLPITDSPILPGVLAANPIAPIPAVFIGPGGGGVGPGGGGPGGGGGTPGGGGPPTVEVPPVIAPVPEPATWLTMIFGFFLLTRALRKTRLAKAPVVALTA